MVREAEFNQLLDAAKKTLSTGDTTELKVAVGQVDALVEKRATTRTSEEGVYAQNRNRSDARGSRRAIS